MNDESANLYTRNTLITVTIYSYYTNTNIHPTIRILFGIGSHGGKGQSHISMSPMHTQEKWPPKHCFAS